MGWMRIPFRSSRTNRDRRDQSFARSVIAEATRRHNEEEKIKLLATRGLCCMTQHANAVPPWTCPCPCHDIEVCPDCYGIGETEQHVSDTVTQMLPCPECNGKGWIQ